MQKIEHCSNIEKKSFENRLKFIINKIFDSIIINVSAGDFKYKALSWQNAQNIDYIKIAKLARTIRTDIYKHEAVYDLLPSWNRNSQVIISQGVVKFAGTKICRVFDSNYNLLKQWNKYITHEEALIELGYVLE